MPIVPQYRQAVKSTMETIDPQIKIRELTEKHPQVIEFLIDNYQFHCVGCFIGQFETLEEGAAVHGITGEDFTKLIAELEDIVNGRVPLPKFAENGTSDTKVLAVNLAGNLYRGSGTTDNLLLFSRLASQYGLRPQVYSEVFNNLYPLYQRSELKQSDLWEMINEELKTAIDPTQDWFGNNLIPALNTTVLSQLEQLAEDGVRIIGVLDAGEEQFKKYLAHDWKGLKAIYRSDQIYATKSELRFWQVLLAAENISPSDLALVDWDSRSRAAAKSIGINPRAKV